MPAARHRRLLPLLAPLLLAASQAHADRGIVWTAQPLRLAPPDSVAPAAPFVPARAAETSGAVRLVPTTAAAFWLDPLELARVRVLSGAPRFARVVGEGGARAVLDEPGVPATRGVFYLAQPPGRGDVWMVTAREPAEIVVERPVRLRGRDVWDAIERDVLAWIDAGGDAPPPELPVVAGAIEARLRLVAEAQLAGLIGPKLARATALWRKASALARLTALRPLAEGPFALAALDVPGSRGDTRLAVDDDGDRPWRRLDAGRRFDVTVDGPGALRVEARALLGRGAAAPVGVAVLAGDVLLGQARGDADRVAAPDPTPRAFPVATPLATGDGEAVGGRAAVTVALAGRRALTVRIDGGPALVRVLHAVRRPRLAQTGAASPAELARAARDALDPTLPGAPLVAAELARLDGAAATAPLPGPLPAELRWTRVLDEARALAGRGDAAGLRALLAGLADAPPELFALLAELFPEPTLVERLRGARIAALDLAWRGRPVDPQVAQAARAAWRAGSWAAVPPDDDVGARRGRGDRPRALAWLVESDPDPLLPPGSLTPLAPGTPRRLVAPAPPDGGRDAARLQVYAVTDADRPGPLTLRVDGAAFSSVAFAPLERLEVALAPGEHDVAVEGPAGMRAYATLPAVAPAVEARADVRRYWPLATASGRATRWQLPDPPVPGPVRISLRALDPVPGEPLRVALRADVGERRTLTFTPGARDPRALAIDDAGVASGEVSFVVRLPAGAREVWLSSSGTQPVVGQVAVRRDAVAAAAAPPPPAIAEPLARVATLSHQLGERPGDARLLLERAAALLELDQTDLARQDVVRLSAAALPPELAPAANALLDRLDDASDFVAVAAPLPAPLAPGLFGLGDARALAAAVPVARALRRLGPDDARAALPEGDGAVARYLRARLDAAPRPLGDTPAALLETVDRLAAALEARAAPRGTAPLLFGLATQARRVADTPRVRRALAVAAALSRWDGIDGTEQNAGLERLTLVDAPPSTPAAEARAALVPAPWSPRRAHTLVPGAGAVLEVDLAQPTKLAAQLVCVELRAVAPPPACVITVAVDGQELRARAVAGAGVGQVPPRTLAPGRHTLSVALARDTPDVLASVRFVADRPLVAGARADPDGSYPVPLERQARYFAATAERPIELAVLGPTTLRVELRAGASGGATVEVGDERRAVALPGGAPREELFVVAAPGAQRVAIRVTSGRVLARLAMRTDFAGVVPPLPAPWWEEAPASSLVPWPGAPPPLATVEGERLDACAPSEFGTLSIEISAGSEPVGERDAPLAGLLGVGQLELSLRRRLGDSAWLRVAATARARESTAGIAGLSAESYLRDLPLALRADLRGAAFTQRYAGEQAGGVAASLRLDRSFELGRAFTWVPSLRGRLAYLSLDRADVVAAGDEVDPDVYTDYLRTHPRQVDARASLWWAPLADQVGQLAAFVVTTRDVVAVDHVGAELEWRSLFPVLGETAVALSYRPTYRLATDDRLESFLRHDLGARLRWSLWTGRTGRFVLGVDGWLVATPDGGARGGAIAVLRYDWTLGRGLTDILPLEESFESLLERRDWELP